MIGSMDMSGCMVEEQLCHKCIDNVRTELLDLSLADEGRTVASISI